MTHPAAPVYGRAAGLLAEVLPAGAVDLDPGPAGDDGTSPCVVVVGSASRDLEPTDPRGWRLGGGVSYAALTLARLGVRTGALVGVDAEAAGAWELDLLRDAGVEVVPVRLRKAPVFELHQAADHRAVRCIEPGQPIPVGLVPPAWRRSPAWLFAPVADELPDGWAAIPAGALVALGWQGLLRDLVAGETIGRRPPRPRPIVERADLVSVSAGDLVPGQELAEVLAPLRPGALCTITCGARGGLALVVRRDRPRPRACRYQALPAVAVDATGAGDTFLAALLAARAIPALAGQVPRLGSALRFAAAVASIHVMGRGLAGVPTLAVVRRRLGPAGGAPLVDEGLAPDTAPRGDDPGPVSPGAGA